MESQCVVTCTERREEEEVEERRANWAYLRIARHAATFVFGTKAQLRTFLWGGGTFISSEWSRCAPTVPCSNCLAARVYAYAL